MPAGYERPRTPLRRVGHQTDILGESPIWHEGEQALYWVDVRRPAVRRLDAATEHVETWPMPGLVGSIAFADDGRLVVAHADRVELFDARRGTFETLARLPRVIPDHRFNDGRLDRRGRFWVGTMNNVTRAPEGTLYRLDPGRGLVSVMADICIPNSLCWSPDGATMYFADSLRYAIDAYAFDPAGGVLGPKRVFATTEAPGFPDGSAVDAEGFVWNAQFNASRIVRYAPDGRIDRIVETPVPRPTSCAFGGSGLDTLFITTTSQNMTEAERAAEPLAGALLALDVGVRGLPEPRFAVSGRQGSL